MKFVTTQLDHLSRFLLDVGAQQATIDTTLPIENIRKAIESPYWPEAVSPAMIIDQDDENAKLNRAHAIVNSFITTNTISGKRFLDFKCGEGHVSRLAGTYASKVVGYDPTITADDPILTADWDVVAQNGPYDVILSYDVFDHLESEAAKQEAIKKIHGILAPGGQLIVRVHPFSSRHACHSYASLNKAFAHFVYTHEEMSAFGCQPLPVLKSIRPIKEYRDIWEAHSFKVISENVINRPLEEFFTSPEMLKFFIDKCWYVDPEVAASPKWLISILSIQFIDYRLTK